MKKTNAKKKLLPAVGMLAISAAMLSSATFAWFTMNKEVKVTGMEVKAHAEEGLLINEVKAAGSDTWDEVATAKSTPETISLRPASTQTMATFWHANSKKSYDEAGVDTLENTVKVGGTDQAPEYYTNVTGGTSGISNETRVGDEGDSPIATGTLGQATGNSMAETHVYYKDASFGAANQYDDGEGYYVVYKYYLKSSKTGDSAYSVAAGNLQVSVTATLKDGSTSTSPVLDNALRVGVQYGDTAGTNYKIFAPIKNTVENVTTGPDLTYNVTTNATGTTASVTAIGTTATGTPTAYTGINTAAVDIPNVTTDGTAFYVYLWFEGEDQNCKSDNLAATLDAYDIDINIKDAGLDTF